jgi:uncharacterized membrane protein
LRVRKIVGWVLVGWLVVSPALAQVQALAGSTGSTAVAGATDSPDTKAPDAPFGKPAEGEAASTDGVAAWVVSQGKTVTYRIAASLDALIVGYLYTGSLLGGGGIALFNAVVSSALYDLHEIAWNDFGPDPQTNPTGIALEKTISYRVVSIINVLATGLLFTGNFWLSSGLALGNAVIDSTIYFFHELAWSTWGPQIKRDLPTGASAGHGA